MIDQEFGHHAQFLTAVGLRLDDVRSNITEISYGQEASVGVKQRAFFLHAIAGEIIVKRKGYDDFILESGCSAGLEHGPDIRLRCPEKTTTTRLLVSSIGQQHAFIRQLPQGLLIVSPNDQPFSRVIGATVSLLETALAHTPDDIAVVRRASEIIMLQLLRFVQQSLMTVGDAPDAIRHDPHLLRSWAAFHGNPAAKWTLEMLASAAGLSRSAYISRFKKAFGAAPLKVITRLRLEQGKYLLKSSNAAISEIALDIGYASDAAFIRAFSRQYAITPGEWRKK